ncbi:MAG: uracil-DNA glycosylase [Acholeplasmatales bacterium]|jgi:uracil-DNA glycosylase|nr:uracil-DNA glycosylase [Acholeplasmatales bacterium]
MKSFDEFLKNEEKSDYFKKLMVFLDNEKRTIVPNKKDWYKAFYLTSAKNTKVVILGQDPYPNIFHASGLAFSTSNTIIPQSLKNIFKELTNDINIDLPKSGDLSLWAKEGVLLLNTILTTVNDVRLAHKNKGWEIFTSNYIKELSQYKSNIVFILWGNNAIKYEQFINKNNNHLIIKSSHPSMLSAQKGFNGSHPFSRTNTFLIENNILPINWSL